MSASRKVAVVDDDHEVRESLAALFQSVNLEVECYGAGREFLDSFAHDGPACVVLDLRLPQESGLEVLVEMSARAINVPVVMISGHGDIPAAVAALKGGAIDFLEKPYRGATLLEAVRRAIDLDQRNLSASAQRGELLNRFESLTPDEKDVLWLTVEGKPDKAIATKLDLSLRTIQLRRASVLRKLHAGSRAELIRLAQSLEQWLAVSG
jgi:FixJ family two-component response regulator